MSQTLFGFHGRYLKIDVGTGASTVVPLSPSHLRNFLGGVGLGTSILLAEGDHRYAPLSPQSSLIFCFSSLVGSPVTTSAKFAVVSRSPLTFMINDAMAGSSFALAGKRTGFDAILLTGKAAKPSVVVIENDQVKLIAADGLWGNSERDVDHELKDRLGNEFEISLIGVAGENLVRYATLSHNGRHAGRGGSGAVLGSKNIKAVAVAGNRRTEWFAPEQLVAISRELSKRSLGDATKKYRELGTVENLVTLNRLGGLPTRNFQSGSFEHADSLSLEQMEKVADKTRSSCAACTIGCEHIYKIRKKAPGSGNLSAARMEYENLFALGPLCGIQDPEIVMQASAKCDRYGLDTISTGASIAFAMECSEKGLIDQSLRFGSADDLLGTIEQIAHRRGFGDLLADGTKRMAQSIGQGSEAFAPHVKGMEIPGYEPRAMKTMALGFAVQTRGADHNRSGAYEADFAEGSSRLEIDEHSAAKAIAAEDRSAIFDSLVLCKFVRRVFDDFYDEAAELLEKVTGWDVDASELETTAKRIVDAKKWYNILCGWTPESDSLPKRFFDNVGGEFNQPIDRERFHSAVVAYNRLRFWNDDGSMNEESAARIEGLLNK